MPAACHLLPPELSLLALQRRVTMEALVRSYLDSIGGEGGLSCLLIKGGSGRYGQLSVSRQVVLG